jgi:thiamine biosynthesis protein ThiI
MLLPGLPLEDCKNVQPATSSPEAQPRDAQVRHSILVHFAEVGLKGRNQPMFRRQLRRNIRIKLRRVGFDWPVQDAVGLCIIHLPPADSDRPLEQVLQALRQVSGVAWITAARRLPAQRFTAESRDRDVAELKRQVVELAQAQYVRGKTFSVRVNRGNKLLPFKSPDLASELGQAIVDQTSWRSVDLKHPDIIFNLDIRCAATFLYGAKLRGPGGLPVGTSGRVLALLSGGIDSPVAAYLMAKRGCRVDFIHFTASPMTREEALESKVWRLAQQLAQFTLGSRLFLVPYVHFDFALMRQKLEYELILFRRFMARVAQRVARQIRARALVSGDTLSQVASQTMSNLVSTSQATDMPLLRPIIAFDKEETIALAQKIGTYTISIEAYKDCCALISGNPKTRSSHHRLIDLETRAFPDYDQLIARTLADAICLDTAGRPDVDLSTPVAPVAGDEPG